MAEGASWGNVGLVEWVKRVSPQFEPPWHLARWAELVEQCLVGGVRAGVAVPVRHVGEAATNLR